MSRDTRKRGGWENRGSRGESKEKAVAGVCGPEAFTSLERPGPDVLFRWRQIVLQPPDTAVASACCDRLRSRQVRH